MKNQKIYYCRECGFEFDKSFLKDGLCNQCRIEMVGWDDDYWIKEAEEERERISISQWHKDDEMKEKLRVNVKKLIEDCSK